MDGPCYARLMLEALVGNRTAALVLLFLDRQNEGYATQLARGLHIPLNMIQKQLDRFAQGTLLVSDRTTRRRMYRWNARHPLHTALRALLRRGNAVPTEDPADGTHLTVSERLHAADSLQRESESLNPVPRPRPFVKTFNSINAYATWKKKQNNPWLF